MIKFLPKNARKSMKIAGAAMGTSLMIGMDSCMKRRHNSVNTLSSKKSEEDSDAEDEEDSTEGSECKLNHRVKGRRASESLLDDHDKKLTEMDFLSVHEETKENCACRTDLLKECETTKSRTRQIKGSKRQFSSQLDLLSNANNELPISSLILDSGNIWSFREALLEAVTKNRKQVLSETMREMMTSDYRLGSFGNTRTNLMNRMQQISAKGSNIMQVHQNEHEGVNLFAVSFSLFVIALASEGLMLGKKNILRSAPFPLFVSKLKGLGDAKKCIAQFAKVLWTRKIIHRLLKNCAETGRINKAAKTENSRISVKVANGIAIRNGSKVEKEKEIKMTITTDKPLFIKINKIWRIKRLTFQLNGQIVNIQII